MKDGFIKVAACTPEIRVADTAFNAEKIIEQMDKCRAAGVKIAVFPELCITGYTCREAHGWQRYARGGGLPRSR